MSFISTGYFRGVYSVEHVGEMPFCCHACCLKPDIQLNHSAQVNRARLIEEHKFVSCL